jgi:tetratricopeptide (TPR) repeat protein
MLARLAEYYFYRGHLTEALEWFDTLLTYELPPSRARAMGLQKAGFLTRVRADFEKARSLLERALAMAREIGDDERAGWALLDLGNAARDTGTLEEVIANFSEALSLFQNLQDVRGTLNSFYELGNTYLQTRELEKARSMWEQGLELSRQLNDQAFIAWGLEGLANVAFLERHIDQARRLHKGSLQLKADVMDMVGIAYSFEGLAQAAAADEEPERAALLWGAAERLREITNTPLEPSRRYVYVSLLPVARAQMGDLTFDETYARGKALKLANAIQLGLEP